MTQASKAASSNSQVSGTWSNPTNAYAETGDDQWCTLTSTTRNGLFEIRYGFAGFSSGEIPDGATINSVTVKLEGHLSAAIGSILEITIQNPAGTDVGNAASTASQTDAQISSAATTIPTLSDLRSGNVVASCVYDRPNSQTSETVYIDFVQIIVDYTASSGPTPHSETAGLTFAGGVQKQTGKGEAGALSFGGALGRDTSTGRSGALTFGGALGKETSRSQAGGLTFSAVLSTIKSVGKGLTAALSFSGDLATQYQAAPQTSPALTAVHVHVET